MPTVSQPCLHSAGKPGEQCCDASRHGRADVSPAFPTHGMGGSTLCTPNTTPNTTEKKAAIFNPSFHDIALSCPPNSTGEPGPGDVPAAPLAAGMLALPHVGTRQGLRAQTAGASAAPIHAEC